MKIPKYCLHKATGQAYVNHDGQRLYLGLHGTADSEERYRRFVRELTNHSLPATTRPGKSICVVELGNVYRKFAEEYFQNSPASMDRIRICLRLLRDDYGRVPVDEFGPKCLQAIQRSMAENGKVRTYINHLAGTIRRVFKWGVSQELVPVTVHQALTTVSGLKRGRTQAREPEPVGPVPDAVVDATVPQLQPIVADMVRFQRLTGCRPGELVLLRPMDVNRSGKVWEYRPESHKTAYRGKERVVYIGPRSQAILRPYLLRPADAYSFSPAEAKDNHNALRREERKSSMTPSQRARKRKTKPQRAPGDHYTVNTYRQQIHRTINRINAERLQQAEKEGIPAKDVTLLPTWSPNQLRHTAGTEVRRQFGLEAAQVTLGHAKAGVTQVYAERDAELAREVARNIG